LPASRGPMTPATNPTTPCGAMIRPVSSGDSCSTCCRYRESTSSSPPFHRPSRKASVVPVPQALAVQQGGLDQRSGVPGLGLHEEGRGRGGCGGGRDDQREVQPSVTPWETAKTTRVTAPVISSAPRTSSRILFLTATARPRRPGQRGGDQADRDVDQEHRAPAGELHEHPAEDLAGHEADARDGAVETDGPGTFGALGEAGGDEGQRGRGDDGGARALHDARRDQQHGVLANPPARLAMANATRPMTNIRRRPSSQRPGRQE